MLDENRQRKGFGEKAVKKTPPEVDFGGFWRPTWASKSEKYRSKRHAKKKTNFKVKTDRARIPQDPPGYPQNTCEKRLSRTP